MAIVLDGRDGQRLTDDVDGPVEVALVLDDHPRAGLVGDLGPGVGNAALGIAALVAIWAAMQALGIGVVDWIRGQLGI